MDPSATLRHSGSPNSPGASQPDHWIDNHGDALYHYALLRVRQPQLAEDLLQETLLSALRAQAQFAGRASERTWLIGILKRKIIDHLRKSARERSFTDLKSCAEEGGARFDTDGGWVHELGPQDWNTGESALARTEFHHAVRGCLEKLPPRLADVFLLREMEDQSTEEICDALSISAANLWVMLHRARLALRQCLESNYFNSAQGLP